MGNLAIDNQRNLIEISPIKIHKPLTNYDILLGKPIEPIKRLQIFSPEEFEEFVLEWIDGYLSQKYETVRRSGGAGDKGRDVIAFIDKIGPRARWDNYQCKHYDHSLSPSDIWIELGKLCYYTYIQEFSIPNSYYFISPQGIGSKLGDYLNNPKRLKEELINNWDKHCKDKITKNVVIDLTGPLLQYVQEFDFSIVKHIPPLDIIKQHAQTRWHVFRFGGGLNKKRPENIVPSIEIQENEVRYVQQLIEAYSDHLKKEISIAELQNFSNLFDHFNRQREYFYCAETFKQFEREISGDDNAFNELKEEVYHGVIDVCDECYTDGFARVNATTQEATKLQLTCNFLVDRLIIQDRKGICHHLSNEDWLIWVKK